MFLLSRSFRAQNASGVTLCSIHQGREESGFQLMDSTSSVRRARVLRVILEVCAILTVLTGVLAGLATYAFGFATGGSSLHLLQVVLLVVVPISTWMSIARRNFGAAGLGFLLFGATMTWIAPEWWMIPLIFACLMTAALAREYLELRSQ